MQQSMCTICSLRITGLLRLYIVYIVVEIFIKEKTFKRLLEVACFCYPDCWFLFFIFIYIHDIKCVLKECKHYSYCSRFYTTCI